MDKNRINYLHERFLEGTLTAAESKEWQQVVRDPQREDQLLSMIEHSWKDIPDRALVDMLEGRSKEILNQIASQPQLKIKGPMLWPRMVAVAAAVVLIVSGVYFFSYRNEIGKQFKDDVVRNDVAPGTLGATLTLANGKKIKLSDAKNGELVKESGMTITKSADGQLIYEIASSRNASSRGTHETGLGQAVNDLGPTGLGTMNTLSTTRGETYIVKLPDGSKVWLNAASSLTYNANLMENGKRHVSLEGEAYFKVARVMIKDQGSQSKEKKMPFIVESKGQQVEVLGTEFNINAYADEDAVKTTLLEGSVKVSSLLSSRGMAKGKAEKVRRQDQHDIVLKPGQQSMLSSNNLIKIQEIDAELAVAWKNNKFVFANQSIEDIMRMVARWYNVEVVYNGPVPDAKFRGSVSRFDKVSKVLQMLESTGSVHFKTEGRTIYVNR